MGDVAWGEYDLGPGGANVGNEIPPLEVMIYLLGMAFSALETVRKEAVRKKCFEYGYHTRSRPLLFCSIFHAFVSSLSLSDAGAKCAGLTTARSFLREPPNNSPQSDLLGSRRAPCASARKTFLNVWQEITAALWHVYVHSTNLEGTSHAARAMMRWRFPHQLCVCLSRTVSPRDFEFASLIGN